jgi:hypothetical protein
MIGIGEFPATDHRVGGIAQLRLLRRRGAITPGYGRADDRATPKSQAIYIHAGTLARPSCPVMVPGGRTTKTQQKRGMLCVNGSGIEPLVVAYATIT